MTYLSCSHYTRQETEELLQQHMNDEAWDPVAIDEEEDSTHEAEDDAINCVFFRRLAKVIGLALGVDSKNGMDWWAVFLCLACAAMSCLTVWVQVRLQTGPTQAAAAGCFSVIMQPDINVTQALCDNPPPGYYPGDKASDISIIVGFVYYAAVNDCMSAGSGGGLHKGACAPNQAERLQILRDYMWNVKIPEAGSHNPRGSIPHVPTPLTRL